MPALQHLSLALMLAFLFSGCASQSRHPSTPPPLVSDVSPIEVADVDVLKVTPEMEHFLQRYVMDYANSNTRRQLLAIAVKSDAMLGFDYDDQRTLTAEEAFNSRSGNCLAFANLLIALARKAGLQARYHEVLISPAWNSLQDTYVIARHINVLIESPGGYFQYDISGQEIQAHDKRRIMKDYEAKALYFNNHAMVAFFEGDLATAHAYLSKAIEIAPRMASIWSNLGVVLARNEQPADAEFSYLTALKLDGADRSAMANLYELYSVQERWEEAERLQARVERYRRENPYYLLALSDEAIQQRQFEESINLLNRALRKNENEHRLHFAMARTQYLSGREEEALSSLNRARELAPENERESYNRPLHELVKMEASDTLY